jgi:ABC-type Fe3+-siderophore transport system permease subunit
MIALRLLAAMGLAAIGTYLLGLIWVRTWDDSVTVTVVAVILLVASGWLVRDSLSRRAGR